MQNTVIEEFEDNPDVVTVVLNQGGGFGESREWLEVFWSNHFLRGGVVWDEDGSIGLSYHQPATGLPFGRWFVIGREGSVVRPAFGYLPQAMIDTIWNELGAGAVPDGNDVPGVPLRIDKSVDGLLDLAWGPSCLSRDSDYAVYEGTIGSYDDQRPVACSTGGVRSAEIDPPSDRSVYYLVVPHNGDYEGAYGNSSLAGPRPPSSLACYQQAVASCP